MRGRREGRERGGGEEKGKGCGWRVKGEESEEAKVSDALTTMCMIFFRIDQPRTFPSTNQSTLL
jgi:hypothetical protein